MVDTPPTETASWLASVTCSVFGAVGASLASWRRKVTVTQALFAVSFGAFIAATLPFIIMSLAPHLSWVLAIPLSGAAGLMVFGLVAWFEVTEKRLPDLTPEQIRDFLLRKQTEEHK